MSKYWENPHLQQQLQLRWPSNPENGRIFFCWIICTCKHAKLTHITLTTQRGLHGQCFCFNEDEKCCWSRCQLNPQCPYNAKMYADMQDDLDITMQRFDKKNIKVLFNDTTLFFLARTCRLTRRNCSILSVCVPLLVCVKKFESVCHLLTSSSGLKFLYSSDKFLFCVRLPNHMCIAVLHNMYPRMHTSSNNKLYISKKSANSLLFEPGLNLDNHI